MKITQAIIASLLASLSLALPLAQPLLDERSSVAAVTDVENNAAIPSIPKYSLGFKGGALTSATKTSSKRSTIATSASVEDTVTIDEQDTGTTVNPPTLDIPSTNLNQTMSDETRRLMDELAKNTARGAGRVTAPEVIDETTPTTSASEVKERDTAIFEDESSAIVSSSNRNSAVETPYALRLGAGSTSRVTARSPAPADSQGTEFSIDKMVSPPAPATKHANDMSMARDVQNARRNVRGGSRPTEGETVACEGYDFLGQPQVCG